MSMYDKDIFDRDNSYDPRYRNIREEYESVRKHLYDVQKQAEYYRDFAREQDVKLSLAIAETKMTKKRNKILELALHIAIDSDERKAEILEQAKKSIEVLNIFEK